MRVHQQRVERSQLMIHTPATKPDTQHDRRNDRSKGLVEVGGLLFTDGMLPLQGDACKRIGCHAVHIADYRKGHMTAVEYQREPTIDGDKSLCDG